jgi:hypothetical protein
MTTTPTNPVVEMYVNGTGWVDLVTARNGDVRLASADSGGGISISRGIPNEGNSVEPTQLDFTINNAEGEYSPKNPNSANFGKIGRYTPVRAGINRHDDSFVGRTVSSGWGTMSDGNTSWSISGTASAFNVSSGSGTIATAGDGSYRYAYFGTFADVEIVVKVKVSNRTSEFGVVARSNHSDKWYSFYISPQTTDQARVGRVSPGDSLAYFEPIGSNVVAGSWYWLKMQVTGQRIRGRIWADGTTEPRNWSIVAYDEITPDFTPPPVTGSIGCFIQGGSAVVTFDSFQSTVWRACAEIAELPPRWDLSRQDRWVPIKARGILRRLGQGKKALESAVTRRFKRFYSNSPLWLPLERAENDTEVTNASPGATRAPASGLTYQADDRVPGISQLATLSTDSAFIQGYTRPHTASLAHTVVFFFCVPQVVASNTVLATIRTSGTAREWRITLRSDSAIQVDGIDSDGSVITTANALLYFDSIPVGSMIACRLEQTLTGGATNSWQFGYHVPGTGQFWVISSSFTGGIGQLRSIRFQSNSVLTAAGNLTVGQVLMWNSTLAFASNSFALAANAYISETGFDRYYRLTGELGIRASWYGLIGDTAPMGPQRELKLVELLEEIAESSGGILSEDREDIGLCLIFRNALYNQQLLELNIDDGHLSDPLEPSDDDQGVRNDVTVTGLLGGARRVVQESGPLNVNDPITDPDGIGTVDESVEVSVAETSQLLPIANFRLGRGTQDDARYPSIRADLTASAYQADADLATQAANLDVGRTFLLANSEVTPDAVEQIVQSYTEEIDLYDWDISWVTTPGRVYRVGISEHTTRIDALYSYTSAAFTSGTSTSLQVTRSDSTKALWILPAAQAAAFPMLIKVSGVVLRVTSISGSSDPQTMTVDATPVNGVVKSVPIGSQVRLHEPWRLAW